MRRTEESYYYKIIGRKGSSFTQLTNSELSVFYEGQQLLKLQSDLSNRLKANNLNVATDNLNFLLGPYKIQ